MKNKLFLISGLTAATSLFGINERPNVIFILADDFGWADTGFNGSTFYETPNLDRLAAEGMNFTNGYAASPVSSPSRVSIMTGKYPANHKITDWIKGFQDGLNKEQLSYYKMVTPTFPHNMPLEEITIANAFKENGYNTYFLGKWHCSHSSAYYPQHQGFDVNIGGWLRGSPNGNSISGKAYYSPYNNPQMTDGPEGEFLTDRLTNEAIELIKNPSSDPFFLYLSYYVVHNPIQPKPEKVGYYRDKAKRMGIDTLPTFSTDFEWYNSHPQPKNHWKERLLQNSPEYAALIEIMDENIGRLLTELKKSGLDENTIIVFTSDNGGLSTAEGSPTSNLPLRAGKGWLYEGGIREPFIIKAPGVTTPGSICKSPVISTDFYPTLLELAGLPIKPDQHQDGISLVPALKGEEIDRNAIYWHYPHYGGKGDAPAAAVRMGDWKLIEFFETGKVELYYLKNDISEQNDLSDIEISRTQVMLQNLHNWQSTVGAKMPVINPDYKFKNMITRSNLLDFEDNSATDITVSLGVQNTAYSTDLSYTNPTSTLNSSKKCAIFKGNTIQPLWWWHGFHFKFNSTVNVGNKQYLHIMMKKDRIESSNVVVTLRNLEGVQTADNDIIRTPVTTEWVDYVGRIPASHVLFNEMYVKFGAQTMDTECFVDEIYIDNNPEPRKTLTAILNKTEKCNYMLYSENGKIVFKTDTEKEISIYNISGQKVFSRRTTKFQWDAPVKSIYIVNIDETTHKIAVE